MVKLARLLFLIVAVVFFTTTVYQFNKALPIPIQVISKDLVKEEAVKSLKILGAPSSEIERVSKGVALAVKSRTNSRIDVALVVTTINDESRFNPNATSVKGYKSYMQTPVATRIFADVDILHGVRILEEKLNMTNNNLLAAMTLYKGGNNPVAKRQAMQTLDKYVWLKKKLLII